MDASIPLSGILIAAMRLTRLVLSDLHLSTGQEPGKPNPFEDFFYDDRFAELLDHHRGGPSAGTELVLNGDILDLLKVKIGGRWPREITDEIAAERVRLCLEGHPIFCAAIQRFLGNPLNRLTYLPGNHDIEMWLPGAQETFIRYVAPEGGEGRIRFITASDTYYLPEGIQIRHGHQFERVHRVDYRNMVTTRKDGTTVLNLPWGALWITDVMNPLKQSRQYIDRVQPLGRFLVASAIFDPKLFLLFSWWSTKHFLRHRIFAFRSFWRGLLAIPSRLREEVFEVTHGFDERCKRVLSRTHGVHTLIVGHSHGPRFVRLPNGKILVNTGTWMKMINLDLHHLGQDSGLTYALIEYDEDGAPSTRLMRWLGTRHLAEPVPYLD